MGSIWSTQITINTSFLGVPNGSHLQSSEKKRKECIFDELWDSRASQFWKGLKKRAGHSSNRKRGLSIDEWAGFVQQRLALRTSAGLRDAALASF